MMRRQPQRNNTSCKSKCQLFDRRLFVIIWALTHMAFALLPFCMQALHLYIWKIRWILMLLCCARRRRRRWWRWQPKIANDTDVGRAFYFKLATFYIVLVCWSYAFCLCLSSISDDFNLMCSLAGWWKARAFWFHGTNLPTWQYMTRMMIWETWLAMTFIILLYFLWLIVIWFGVQWIFQSRPLFGECYF